MKAVYHRLAVRDARQILDYYETEAGALLSDRFFQDLLTSVSRALENPRHHPPIGETLRRANLTDFPYHFLFEEKPWGIKVLVLRHHHRSPRFGLRRK